MAYKRQIDRLPIIPKDAKEHNVTCHYCIVGCGYKAYTWPANKQGGMACRPKQVFLALTSPSSSRLRPMPRWYAPSMYNVVIAKMARTFTIVIKPDQDCVVNSGLGSIRGARMAEMSYSQQRNTELQRLTDPMVWRYGQMQPTGWADALDLVARVTVAVINDRAPRRDCLFPPTTTAAPAAAMKTPGAPGKLSFSGPMKTAKNIRIQRNRLPAYNSEVGTRRATWVWASSTTATKMPNWRTPLSRSVPTRWSRTQTNYFLNHWVPNLRGTSMDKKKAEFGSEPLEKTRIVIVDPRRTVTVNACEVEAGKDNVMHLALNSGTDLALFNAWMTYIADKGWTDKAFIDASTTDFDKMRAANKVSLEDAARITGLTADQIRKSAEWIAQPKAGNIRRRTMFAYEKGLIWGNDNYRTNGALVNVALATGNVGRPGGGCVRMGGHQ